jgi:hypothetical protein
MSETPENYPADIIAAADDVVTRGYNEGLIESVCRALLERDRAATERAAKIAEGFLTKREAMLQVEYVVNDRHGGDACVDDFVPIIADFIAAAIRSEP